MNNIKKIEYARGLRDRKNELLRMVEDIKMRQFDHMEDCEHISVDQKAPDIFPHYGHHFRCLLCEKHLGMRTPLFIDATHYLEDLYSDLIPNERDEKFDNIQTLALGLWRENPLMSQQELVDHVNTLISENKNEIANQLKKIGK